MTPDEIRAALREYQETYPGRVTIAHGDPQSRALGRVASMENIAILLAALDDAERVATERALALVEQRAAEATRIYDDHPLRTGYNEGRMDALNAMAEELRESAKGGE